MQIKTRIIDAMEKLLPARGPQTSLLTGPEPLIFQNERYCFQAAYICISEMALGSMEAMVEIVSDIAGCVTVKKVRCVPVEYATAFRDDNYISASPGLFPDYIEPFNDPSGRKRIVASPHWKSLWLEIAPRKNVPAGRYAIEIVFKAPDGGAVLARAVASVRISGEKLPPLRLKHTEWFHGDCIANWYGFEPLSDGHMDMMEKYVKTAVDHGINMILTPVFTPPLDTYVGGERLTMQLVDVARVDGNYSFNFDKLDKWIEMCRRSGIEYFEISHLFTQWGAAHAPKVMACDNGEYNRIFGWETEALSQEYEDFLRSFLPRLKERLVELGVYDRCYFHISDEPGIDQLEAYRGAKEIVESCLPDCRIIDALSDIEFYRKGTLRKPIVATDHIAPFIAENVEGLWAYYCCGQCNEVSNRFIAMPGQRERIISTQLYKYDIEGFLHWGYNFWNSGGSRYSINPFMTNDGDFSFPAGDSFLVYPGPDGPHESIRLKLMAQALYDLRAYQMLEELVGKDEVLKIIDGLAGMEITFDHYPQDALYIRNVRDTVNERIMKCQML